MKNVLLILVLLFSRSGFAQEDCTYHYYKNKRVSTSICYGKGFNGGKAKAFDRTGKVIYEKSVRKFAGHSYVLFSWYESGAVKRAEWHDAPDAGIQWYQSITTFSEDGKVLDVQEQSHDDLHRPGVVMMAPDTLVKRPAPKKKEVVKCAVIYSSEFWFVNRTRYSVIVHADRISKGGESTATRLGPGESAKGGAMILAEQFENPERYYQFSVIRAEGKRLRAVIKYDRQEQGSKETRRYYFEIK